MHARVLIALFLVALFALGAVVLAADSSDEANVGSGGTDFEGAVMPAGVRAPDFTLRNQDGKRVSMRELRGQPVIVTFLYTTCDDTCPAQAQTVRGALDDLGEDVPALAIAVDPPRDTPRARPRVPGQGARAGADRLPAGQPRRAAAALEALLHPPPVGLGGAPGALHARRQARLPAHRLPGRPGDAGDPGARRAAAAGGGVRLSRNPEGRRSPRGRRGWPRS